MFTDLFHKLSILILSVLLVAVLGGTMYIMTQTAMASCPPIVLQAMDAVKENMPALGEANSQLNQNTNILDIILNYDINQ